ncbi:zinc-binding dehydrogenase [Afifella pfennigii]|uniref:zinc-binding dehydrogenase n=1 Tax=Afifella pfennigii TaxID=209897 RepID=UPI00047DC044|nr:zinc-binding dehydrogenase [Afifella pfennigii]
MQAVRLMERGRGGVRVVDIPEPERPQGFVLLRMIAASVNRVDLYMRDSGAGISHSLPQTMGVDGIGEVLECDADSHFRKGERAIIYPYVFCGSCRHCLAGEQPLCLRASIFGEHRDGTFAQYLAVPQTSLLPLAATADIYAAAALGVAYLTAWRMVFGKAPVHPGATVLVQGAAGGVSYAAIQLALMAGARVIATTGGEAKSAHFRSLGIEVVDYRSENVVKAVAALTGGEGADVVIDNSGEASWSQSLRSLRRGGHLVTCGATTGGHPSAEIQRLFVRQLSVHGSTLGSVEELRRLLAAFQTGALTPRIDSVFPLDRIEDALARLEHPDRIGKVVVDIAGD